MATEQQVENACHAVAACIIGDVLSREGAYDWGDYPEIGERDWDRITEIIREVAAKTFPDAEDLYAASSLLIARANSCRI